MKNDNVQCKTDNTKDKAQENHVKMTQTPVPSLILRLSCSTIVSMLAGTTYNIVDMYFVSGLGNSGWLYIWHGGRQQNIPIFGRTERKGSR